MVNANPYRSQRSGQEGWYTPERVIVAARRTLGDIELDPATAAAAQQVVQAKRFYTIEQDSLRLSWEAGSVWLNPPYTRKVIDAFAVKLLEAYRSGTIQRAIWLSNNSTETSWFQMLSAEAKAVFFPRGRLDYWRLDDAGHRVKGPPLQGQALLYFGDAPERFAEEFTCAIGGLAMRPYPLTTGVQCGRMIL